MAASVIGRATWTDDDGTGTTGTILNNARLQADIYDKVDAMFAGTGSYVTFEFGGNVRVAGGAGTGKGPSTAPSVSAANDWAADYDTVEAQFKISPNAAADRGITEDAEVVRGTE